MATIVTRSGKGSALTHNEMDSNFTNLNNETVSNTNNKVDKVSSTDNAIVRFNGSTGAVQNSSVRIDDNGNMTIPVGAVSRVNNSSDGSRRIAWSPNPYYEALTSDGANIQQVLHRGNNNGFGLGCTANGDFVMATANYSNGAITERVRILSSGGITFNGDTSSANALDDYEEGTWTPRFIGSGTQGNYTIAYNAGTYTKIGNLVFLQASLIDIVQVTAGSSNMIVIDLPFIIKNSTAYERGVQGSATIRQNAGTIQGSVMANGHKNTKFLSLAVQYPDSFDPLPLATYFQNNMDISISLVYQTN